MNVLPEYDIDIVCDGVVVEEFDLSRSPGLSAPFKMAKFKLEPGTRSEIDSHKVQEIWTIVNGQGRLHSQGTVMQVKAGQALHFPSHVDHWMENDGAQTLEILTVWW